MKTRKKISETNHNIMFQYLVLLLLPSLVTAQIYLPETGIFNINITSPASLIGTLYYLPSYYTPPISLSNGQIYLNTVIVLPNSKDDVFGCIPFKNYSTTNGTPIQGKAILLSRGVCTFYQKSINAQALNVSLVIIYDSISSIQLSTIRSYWDNIYSVGGNGIPAPIVPTISISNHDGILLSNVLKTMPSTIIDMSIEGTGPINSNDKNILNDLLNSVNFTIQNPTTIATLNYAGLRAWNLYELNRNDLDPCLMPLAGLWCIEGKIVSLRWLSLNPIGIIPDSFGFLDKLKFLDIESSSLLSLGSGIGMLHNLQVLIITNSPYITSIPDLRNLTFIRRFEVLNLLKVNKIPFLYSSNLSWLSFSGTGINSGILDLVANLHSNTTYIDVSNNKIIEFFPDISSFYYLQYFDISSNSFSGSINPISFDNKPFLLKLYLLFNNLNGPLPFLTGSFFIQLIDISNNKFTGPIPSSWSSLLALQQFHGQNNLLTSPLLPLVSIITLTVIDLSYNNITNDYYASGTSIPDIIGFICQHVMNANTQSLNLESNQLAGIISSGRSLALFLKLTTLSLAKNKIQSTLPNDLFILGIGSLDLSNNNLYGFIPVTQPGATSRQLYLHNNPLLSSIPLPTWIYFDYQSFKISNGESYLCPSLKTIVTGLDFTLDPTAFLYQGCQCNSGYYSISDIGINCLLIPDSKVINSTIPIYNTFNFTSHNKGIISDNEYGSKRYITGMNTFWSIDTIDSVLVLNIMLFVNLDLFINFTNNIIIYQGFDLNGPEIFKLRGDEIIRLNQSMTDFYKYKTNYFTEDKYFNNTGLFEIQILDSKANIQFISRDTLGEHFIIEYYPISSCPNNYYISNNKCILIPLCTINDYSYNIINQNTNDLNIELIFYKSSITPCIDNAIGSFSLPTPIIISKNYLPNSNVYALIFKILSIIAIIIYVIIICIPYFTIKGFISLSGVKEVRLKFLAKRILSLDSQTIHSFSKLIIWEASNNEILIIYTLGCILSNILILYNMGILNSELCRLRFVLLIVSYIVQYNSLAIMNLTSIKKESGLLYSQIQWKRKILIFLVSIVSINLVLILILVLNENFNSFQEITVPVFSNATIQNYSCSVESTNLFTKILVLFILSFNGVLSIINWFIIFLRTFNLYYMSIDKRDKIQVKKINKYKVQCISIMLTSSILFFSYLILFTYSYISDNNLSITFVQNSLLIANGLLSHLTLYLPSLIVYMRLIKTKQYKRDKINKLFDRKTYIEEEIEKVSSKSSKSSYISTTVNYYDDLELEQLVQYKGKSETLNSLIATLINPIAVIQLLKFAEKRKVEENVLFLMDVTKLTHSLPAYGKKNIKLKIESQIVNVDDQTIGCNISLKNLFENVQNIYNTYITQNSVHQINISGMQKGEIERRISNLLTQIIIYSRKKIYNGNEILESPKLEDTKQLFIAEQMKLKLEELIIKNIINKNESDEKLVGNVFEYISINKEIPANLQILACGVYEDTTKEVMNLLRTNDWNDFLKSENAIKANELYTQCDKFKNLSSLEIDSIITQLEEYKKLESNKTLD